MPYLVHARLADKGEHHLQCFSLSCREASYTIITLRNEIAKVMFLHVSVSHSVHGGGGAIPAFIAGGIPACLSAGDVVSQHALQVVSQHALQKRGCLLQGVCSRGMWRPPAPESRRLLLRMVRILLECILILRL